MTSAEFRDAVRKAYEYAHSHCRYGATDRSYPVGEDGVIDCTGLVLRALYLLGKVGGHLNCDEMDALMPVFGFTKSTDMQDIYRHPVCVVQWVQPQWRGTNHVHHTYVCVNAHSDGTIDKYDLGSDARINADQPFARVPVNEWGDALAFKYIWYLDDGDGIEILLGGKSMKTLKLAQIKKGDKGNAVLLLQEILKSRKQYDGELDKQFGSITEKALIDYQTARIRMGANIGKADGICGEKTWSDLLGLPEA
jgi:hypothetical protein